MILLCEIVLLVIVGLVSDTAADVPMSMLVSFATALQVATFRQLRNRSFTTTITTNNLVTAMTSSIQAISQRDRVAGQQAFSFSCIVVSFLTGATTGGVATRELNGSAVLIPAGMLAILLLWLVKDKKVHKS